MKSSLPPPPPRDAHLDAERTAQFRRRERRAWGDIASVFAQCFLALLGGAWAAASSAPAWPPAAVLGGAGMFFALGLAWGAVFGMRLLALLWNAPRLLRFATAQPAPPRLAPQRGDVLWIAAIGLAHGLSLAFGAACVIALLWWFVPALALGATALRFLVLVGALSLLTLRAGRVMV